jgi:hypothetical protein
MVSTFKLAQRRDIVLCPPENTLSTATADAKDGSELSLKRKKMERRSVHAPGMDKRSQASLYKLGNDARRPNHHWIGLHVSKSSRGSFQNSRSSSTAMQGFQNQAVKLFFRVRGDLEINRSGEGVGADLFA